MGVSGVSLCFPAPNVSAELMITSLDGCVIVSLRPVVITFGAGRSGGVKRPGCRSGGERWLIMGGKSGGVRWIEAGTAGLLFGGVRCIAVGKATVCLCPSPQISESLISLGIGTVVVSSFCRRMVERVVIGPAVLASGRHFAGV